MDWQHEELRDLQNEWLDEFIESDEANGGCSQHRPEVYRIAFAAVIHLVTVDGLMQGHESYLELYDRVFDERDAFDGGYVPSNPTAYLAAYNAILPLLTTDMHAEFTGHIESEIRRLHAQK